MECAKNLVNKYAHSHVESSNLIKISKQYGYQKSIIAHNKSVTLIKYKLIVTY